MLQTVKGYYENGNIVLEEKPDFEEKIPVLVTFGDFMPEQNNILEGTGRKIGGLEGKFTVPVDFDEPLDDLKEYM